MGGDAPRIEAVLFDVGGTLVDGRDYLGWCSLAREVALDVEPDELRHSFSEVEREVDRSPIGSGPDPGRLPEFWRRVLSRATGRELDRSVAERFVASAPHAPERPAALYSDVRRCLDALAASRRRLGVISNSRSEASVRGLLERAGIVGYFEQVLSSGTEGVEKPDPEIFRRAVGRLGIAPERALYVGNLEHTDALGARAAGLHGLWLNRDGTGLDDGTPEITSLLEVPLVVHQLELSGAAGRPAGLSHA